MIFIRTDILNPYNPKIVSQDNYSTLIKFLIKYFPSGFDRPVDISVNGVVIEVDEYDIALGEDDVIVLLDRSALPVGLIGGWFITALANLAISVTLSYVANKLFAPGEPEEQAKPSSVYTIASGQNVARYGSPIPIVYGKVRMYPSMIVNPFYRFEDNIEYLYHILCIGQGQYTTDSVMIGEDTITTAGDLQYKLMNKDTFYNIPLNAYGIHITRTLSSPSNLELKEGELTEEYTIKQGTQTVEFDYHYPNGIYASNPSGGYDWGTAAFSYFIRSSTGTLLASGRAQDAGMSADPIQKTVARNVSAWTVDDYVTISFQQDVTLDDPSYSETNYVKRVKEIYPNKDFTQLYGDITLLACKIKATNAVSTAGQVKVNGYFERTDVGNSMEEVLSDIYTNTNYGGALSADDLDFPVTGATVDCAYESNQTIFDAMRKPALAQGYSVFLAGMDVIMKKDGVNNITSGMYNEQNILRDSLKVQYLFKEESPSYDGYEVSYIDGDGFVPATATYPTNAIRPQKVDLFGVVDWGEPLYHILDMTVTTTVGPGITYDGAVTYEDNGDGTWRVWSDESSAVLYFSQNETSVTEVVINSTPALTSAAYLFNTCTNLTNVSLDGLNTSSLTTIESMFSSCQSLLSLDLSCFTGTTTTINCQTAFQYCEVIEKLDLTPLRDCVMGNTASMFLGCYQLTCISNVDTTSAVNKANMFVSTNSLTNPNASEQTSLQSAGGFDYWNPDACI